jgi:hypothetical protein
LEADTFLNGFGNAFQLDDYRTVRGSISTFSNITDASEPETIADVFTLKSNSWRTIQGHRCSVVMDCTGRLSNGVLHCLVRQENGVSKKLAIVSFDLAEEKPVVMLKQQHCPAAAAAPRTLFQEIADEVLIS